MSLKNGEVCPMLLVIDLSEWENLERLTLIEMEEFLKGHRGVKTAAAGGGAYNFVERYCATKGPAAEEDCQGNGAAILDQGDRTESGADHAADWPVAGEPAGATEASPEYSATRRGVGSVDSCPARSS